MRNHLSKFLNWIRVVIPDFRIFLGVTAIILLEYCYLIFLASFLSLFWTGDDFLFLENERLIFEHAELGFLIISCFVFVGYGIVRVIGFNPLWTPNYLDFLKSSPWEKDKQLPFGSVNLKFQDIALLSLWILMLVPLLSWKVIFIPICFMAGYLLPTTYTFFAMKVWRSFFIQAYLFGIVALVLFFVLTQIKPDGTIISAQNLYMGLITLYLLLSMAYALAILGNNILFQRISTREIDFQDLKYIPKIRNHSEFEANQKIPSAEIGWPFDNLRPVTLNNEKNFLRNVLWSLLVGWWWFIILFGMMNVMTISPRDVDDAKLFAGLLLKIAPVFLAVMPISKIIETGIYPAINLIGRIANRKLILPKFDSIFLPCLAGIVCSHLMVLVIEKFNLPMEFGGVVVWSTSLFVFLSLQPNYAEWQLTSEGRLVSVEKAKQKKELQKT